LPISMPIVAMVAIDLLDMAVLRLTLAPSQHHPPVGQEHGRTIPLAVVQSSRSPNHKADPSKDIGRTTILGVPLELELENRVFGNDQ
jgi:hypothetical protein